MFIDTHTHLTFPDFSEDLEESIKRAREVGVEKLIVPAIDLQTSRTAIALAERIPDIYAAIGVHPQDSKQFQPEQLEEFIQLTHHQKVVAIGEIGLDYYRDYAPKEDQQKVLRSFLELASDTQLPVIIHNRAAFTDLMAIMQDAQYRAISGVFHCFSEDETATQKVFDLGFVVSFTGTITFKNSKSARVARKIPLDKQLLETDSPFMAPVPNRGKRNEPANIKYIAEKQSELHGISVEEVGQITTRTAYQTFPRLQN